jgi:curved DNA-binding protein CbpA|nr:MAG TPA: DnaJ-like protein [Caudoviricetes sp.]
MKYFTTCTTLDELKKEFRRLAMLHHPDHGGDTETMKAINAEYDAVFPVFKLAYNRTAKTPTAETAQSTRSEFYTANGWKGSNYESGRSLKEIAQLVRQFIQEWRSVPVARSNSPPINSASAPPTLPCARNSAWT